jgi:hypothetical protein
MSQAKTADMPSTRYCLGGGYIIDHLPEPRCPECGRQFDRNRPETYYIRSPSLKQTIIRRGLPSLGAYLLGGAGPLFLLLRPDERVHSSYSPMLAVISLTCIGLGCLWAASAAFLFQDWVPPWKRRTGFRWLLTPAWAFMMTILTMATFVCFSLALMLLIGSARP